MSLSETQIDRYSRQIILPEVGGRGQQRLIDTSLLLLGSDEPVASAATYLVGAGIGRLGILDTVTTKADAFAADLRATNSEVDIVVDPRQPIDAADLIVAGTTVNAARSRPGSREIPLIAGDIRGACGWLTLHTTFPANCPACASASAAPWIDSSGDELQPVAVGAIAAMMAAEALKVALGLRDPGAPALRCFDARVVEWCELPLIPKTDCAACAAEAPPGV